MTSFSTKIFEIFRNLKSDAVPKPPRPETVNVENNEINGENTSYNDPEEIINDPDLKKKSDKKTKNNGKDTFKKDKKNVFGFPKVGKENTYDRQNSNNNVNTQATGNVVNIVGSRGIRVGNEIVYYLGPTNVNNKNEKAPQEQIEKCNLITLLMEANTKPDHDYIDYISKNLGKNWYSFFRRLGYTQGRIETVEIDESRLGVSEARYKLLLDWIRNDEKGTLGHLATHLWEEGERQIVKEMAVMYKSKK